MIKLNNKNITYVALADSNNSLKAPKEIWYADTNNSVKLVYRRKDALIEGEDYEKYHWLVGDGTAYIDTGIIIPNEIVYVKTRIINTSNDYDESIAQNYNSFPFSNRNDADPQPQVSVIQRRDLSKLFNDIFRPRQEISYAVGDIIEIDVATSRVQNGEATLRFFYSDASNLTPKCWDGKISNFEVESLESAFKISLVPCKLIKPVPKWLDANGIRRQVGECGMIDLVSGKFYGNVNSVGTFTVENYYERKEWLCGDGNAYIEGISYNLWTNQVETKIGKINVTTTENNEIHYKAGSNTWAVQQNPTLTIKLICIFRESGNGVHIVRVDSMPSQVTLSFYQNGGYAYCLYDDTEYKGGALNQSSWDTDITPNIFSYKMSYIREVLPDGSYRSNLIPCTLTMDLPASMDANNIARTKGTSGMWDLVSDRFYGNVANSGTFKAVNLAEGVDYEVHQWLKTGSGYPHIQVDYNCNTDNGAYIETRYKCNYSNPGFDMIIGFSINQNNNIGIRIFNAINNTYVDYHKTENGVHSTSRTLKSQSNINAERYIKATLDNLIIDSTEYPSINWGSGFDNINRQGTILYTNQGDNDMHYAETKLRVNNVEHDLIPVKLLKSIPSQYDANGIARQAGECGMYDTVNDLFYGNVASSGTFSVSDD